MLADIPQKLLFVTGKGGVGRTSFSAALGLLWANKSQRTLIVQWSIEDAVSPIFGKKPCSHKAIEVFPNLFTMNFVASEAVREYFVDHLKMKLLHDFIIENRHVQKLVQVAPGFQELFFLGRLFWLVKLSAEIKGEAYDRIIVDSPATGHGLSLLSVSKTVASFGMTGPLAAESERVSSLLSEANTVGVVNVTLPEELPIEETLEFLPKMEKDLGRKPLAIVLNRSLNSFFSPEDFESDLWVRDTLKNPSQECDAGLSLFWNDIKNKTLFEKTLRDRVDPSIPILTLPEILVTLETPGISEKIVKGLSVSI